MADQLEAERPGWSWPGYAYVLGWFNLVAGQRIEDVDIVAVALGPVDHIIMSSKKMDTNPRRENFLTSVVSAIELLRIIGQSFI